MRCKVRLVISIILLACMCNLPAQIVLDDAYEQKAYPKSVFEIRAYKNNPDPILLTIYDALTGTLAAIENQAEINIYPYLANFVMTDPEQIGPDQAVFSYFISGSRNQKFTLEIIPTPFNNRVLVSAATETDEAKYEDHYIDAVYKLIDNRAYFSKTKTTTDQLKQNTIVEGVTTTTPIHTVSEKGVALNNSIVVNWDVTPVGGNPSKDFWAAEGIILMGIQKSGKYGYDGVISGTYKANITIKLTSKL